MKKEINRLCIACRELKDKRELVRVIRYKDKIEIDLTGKKDGRGAYLCNNRECLEKAIKTKALEKSFKQAISKSVYDELSSEIGRENE